jgi:signal transduction histidine kinase/DNA-binding response OmpR family regulator
VPGDRLAAVVEQAGWPGVDAAEHGALLKFLNAAPVGLLQLSPNGDVQLINGQSARLLLPLARERSLDNLFEALADHAPKLRQQAAAFKAAHGTICQDLRLDVAPPSGVQRAVQFIALTLVKLDHDQLLATLTDITEQVLLARALQASQTRLRLAMDALSMAEWELDLQTGAVRRSAQHDRLFGHAQAQADWSLDTFLQQVHIDDLAAVTHSFQTALASGPDWRCEFRVVWPDGSVHWLSAHGHVDRSDAGAGAAGCLLCILVDCTVQCEAAAEHARAQALEDENRRLHETNRLKGQFLANMSHELRTPLNAIIGFAELLQRSSVPVGSAKQQQFLSHIASSGHHLLQLINDVLDTAKVDSGKLAFTPQPIDLPALVAEVLGVLEAGIQAKQLTAVTDIDPAVASGLQLDPLRLKQLLFNFLSNAIKFTPEGGRVTLRALPQGPDHVRLEVEDNGIGIAPEKIGQLFVDFHQLDGGLNKKHQGTGLGLALTRRLVEAQGGRVGVHSSPGLSTVFHAVLNRIHGHDAKRPPGAEPAVQGNDRLLVIEHDPLRRSQLLQGLAGEGRQVDAAATAQQAGERSASTRYEAITLDLLLPDLTGLGTLSGIRGGSASRHAPVVGLTLPTEGDHAASFAITNVLSKPIRGDEVLRALSTLHVPGPQPARVLVVDDDTLALALMRATLAGIGVDALCLVDSRQALATVARERPDALILDLMMPVMDGFQVLDALRHDPVGRDLPVYIWTSMTLSDEEYATLTRSARAILGKGGADLSSMIDDLQRWWSAASKATAA